MATAFPQSMRSLAADGWRWWYVSLLLIVVFLGAWGAWGMLAGVVLYEVTSTARLEVDQAGHPIAAPLSGQVVATSLTVGKSVAAGEVLVELDSATTRLEYEEADVRIAALQAQRQARGAEMGAEDVARQHERQAAPGAVAEAQARHREAEITAQAAAEQATIYARLHARGLAPQLDFLRTRAAAEEKRAAAEALRLAIRRLESDQRTRDSDRRARLTQFQREVTRLDGDIRSAEATRARLAHLLEQARIRAPIAGRLGASATLHKGAVVRQGDIVGVVLPAGTLRVVAAFAPAVALGRVRAGQAARLRLEGFPWAQYGSLPATVTNVADEGRDGSIRVELALLPDVPTTIPLQHGLPGTVEVAVAQVSPVTLLLRSVGKRFGVTTSPDRLALVARP